MSDRWGIDGEYMDAVGKPCTVDPTVVEHLRELIGQPPEHSVAPLFARRGADLPAGVVELEDGGEVRLDGGPAVELPIGYHRLHVDRGQPRLLVAAPPRCVEPEQRAWGWAVQLYAARSTRSWGIGDLTDLDELAAWSARDLAAGFLLINPLGATAPAGPQQPSPYSPAARRFRNPIYLRVEDVPGAAALGDELTRVARAGRALNSDRIIDRDLVHRLKLLTLERIWARVRDDPGPAFTTWWAAASPALREFAWWSVLAERLGSDWRGWPEQYRRPGNPQVAEFGAENQDRVRFHGWLQWNLHEQLSRSAEHLTVIQDLPVGFDPGGADAWAWQDLLAEGVSVGAPPDEFNPAGQDWGLPAFVPWRLAQAGYEPFVETIRAALTTGGLRIDHVMGLFRLWWIPAAAGAGAGAYVRQQHEDLLDLLALESVRAQAVVVGEDLGTVEDSARTAMTERGLLSYRLLWFEEGPPEDWPAAAMAAITTHDLPTVAGLWDGSDLQDQRAAGLQPNAESTARIRDRLERDTGLASDLAPAQVVPAAHRLLARSPCTLLTACLDDAFAEPARPNIPGADGNRPNWSLALPRPVDELRTDLMTNRIARILGGVTGAS